MIPIHGVYLLLIMAGTTEIPERIGLEQQLDMERCQSKAQRADAEQKYVVIRCIYDGAIISPTLPEG